MKQKAKREAIYNLVSRDSGQVIAQVTLDQWIKDYPRFNNQALREIGIGGIYYFNDMIALIRVQ